MWKNWGAGMANSVGVESYVHIEGFDEWHRDAFDKRKVRAGMRKAGKIVAGQSQLNIALARGAGQYPISRTGRLVHAIAYRVSKSGFLVKIAPDKTDDMKDYYPAYLHYGVRRNRSKWAMKARRRQPEGPYRIAPRGNYVQDALQDKKSRVQDVLRAAFGAALG